MTLTLIPNLATRIRRAIYGAMSSDTTLNSLLSTRRPSGRSKSIYYAYAPDGAGAPYVIFNKQSGTPTYTFKDGHAFADNEVWLIKGVAYDGPEIVAEDPMDAADNIASRLDALLTDYPLSLPAATPSVEGVVQLYLRRESDIGFAETAEGEVYYHAGGLYRLIYSAT